MKKENCMIMLGKFPENSLGYANKRKDSVSEITEARIRKKEYLEVIAGPFTKDEANNILLKLKEKGLCGCIFTESSNQEAE